MSESREWPKSPDRGDEQDSTAAPAAEIAPLSDLERLFQEAEQTIDQIVLSKKSLQLQQDEEIEIIQSEDEPTGDPPQHQVMLELELIQQKYRQMEFEFINYKNRTDRMLQQYASTAKSEVLKDFIEILDLFQYADKTFNSDSFSHTVESYQKGFNLLHKQLNDFLAQMGLQRVHTVGQPFDPNVHQAVAVEESDRYNRQTIIKEIKPGYLYSDMLLRPALVKVGQPPKNNHT